MAPPILTIREYDHTIRDPYADTKFPSLGAIYTRGYEKLVIFDRNGRYLGNGAR